MDNTKNIIKKRTLYLVATPIGNLSDISHRALKTLTECDFIAAEDTRVTLKLLTYFGIKKPLISYNEYNKAHSTPEIIGRIRQGETCALVTDAGMPAISDPGEELVRLCMEDGIGVTAVPGACAAVTALSLSGLCTGRFCFEGFLTVSKSGRREHLTELSSEYRTMIFYEAPHKLRQTLADMYAMLGDRKITIVRELTKLNEEITATTLGEAVNFYTEKNPIGEFVLIVAGAKKSAAPEAEDYSQIPPAEHVRLYMDGGMAKMDAVKRAAADRGVGKSEFYKLLLADEGKR